MTVWDILRAIVTGDRAALTSPEWVRNALDAIDGHEAAQSKSSGGKKS